MNAACRVFPECFNAFGHQKHITAQKHNTFLHGSASFTSTPSSFPWANIQKVPTSPTRAEIRNFPRSEGKWKFTMTLKLIHTHLTSFYLGCLRNARYTEFAEVRGGVIKMCNTSGSGLIGLLWRSSTHTKQKPNLPPQVWRWKFSRSEFPKPCINCNHVQLSLLY